MPSTVLPRGRGWLERPPENRGYNSIYTKALGAVQCQEVARTLTHCHPATFSEDCYAIVRGDRVGTAFSPIGHFSRRTA